MVALIWLIVGVALVAGEVLSGDFVLLMLGVSGLAAAGAAALSGSIIISVVVFAVLSIGLVLGARPALKRRMNRGIGAQTNVDALVGSRAVAVTEVNHDGGRVKIGGDVWSARTAVEGDVIVSGTAVTVVEIAGATAVVLAQR